MTLHVGQKVVCLDNRRRAGGVYARETLPEVGAVYTIRAIVSAAVLGYEEDGLRLVEIVNAARPYASPRGLTTWRSCSASVVSDRCAPPASTPS
jgi:hypothetical protein